MRRTHCGSHRHLEEDSDKMPITSLLSKIIEEETNHEDQSVESARKRDGDWTAKSNNKASQRKSCKTKSTDESVVSVLIRRGKKQTTKIKV